MKLYDYSIFPSSWKTDADGYDDNDATSKRSLSSPLPLLSGCELAACNTNTATNLTTTTTTTVVATTSPSVLMAPPVTADPNFVNMYIIVDPTKQTVTFPQQIVTHKAGDVVSTAVVGSFIIGDQQLQALVQVAQAMTTTNFNINNSVNNSSSSSLVPNVAAPLTAVAAPPVTFSADATQKTLESLHNLNKSDNTVATAALPPLKPLSAYNFFFRDERDRILNESREHDWSLNKQQKLLNDHWGRDRNAKRRHRKTHGKIDFTTLSRLISTRWKKLADHHKDFYRQVACLDFERYQRETNHHQLILIPNDSTSSFIHDYFAVVA